MKKLITFMFSIILLFMVSTVSNAWEQNTHIRINLEAIKKFNHTFGNTKKYLKAPLVKENTYIGLEVSSSSLLDKNYKTSIVNKTFEGWIIHGGYSADEPNLYASVRHFYDPLALSGKTWLTDQVSMHGTWNYIANQKVPEIDAKVWGLNHEDNPYSFQKAMEYYYKSMTIRESQTPVGFLPGGSSRSRYVKASSLEEERKLYLAAAFRALGETMHMLADMTQPAHVRNDSHPKLEPLEQTINQHYVQDFAHLIVDPEIGKYFISASASEKYSVEQLFEETAKYTNKNFFSADTIYDKAKGILPKNGEGTYPNPQLSNLIPKNSYFGSNRMITGSTVYFGTFNGVEVPLARVDMLDRLNSEGLILKNRVEEYVTGFNFNISPTMALKQGEVLIPVAIAACSDLIDRFIPTMELEVEIGTAEIERDAKNNEKAIYPVTAMMKHDIDKDSEWKKANMQIQYSGPGTVIIVGEDRSLRQIRVSFVEGKISQVQDYKNKKKMVDGPLKLYMKKSAKIKLTKEEAFFEVLEGDMLYIEVEAGGRFFESNTVYIDGVESVLEISYEPENPSRLDEIYFLSTGRELLYYVWEFGDGNSQTGRAIIDTMHRYEKNGEYEVKVSAYKDSAMTEIESVGRTKIKLEEKFDISFVPGNNLEARAGDTVEIGIRPVEEKTKLALYKITWETPGGEGNSSTDKIQLNYKETGRYNIGVKIFNDHGEMVSSNNAVIDIVEGAALSIEPLEATVLMKKTQKYTAMIDGKPTTDVVWSVREGEIGGTFKNYQTYTAPETPGVYHIVATLKSDPLKTAITAVNVVRPSGSWKLVNYTKDEQPNSMGNSNYPHYSGSSSSGDTSYTAEVAYDPPNRPAEAFNYTMNAAWDEMPDFLRPHDTLELNYKLGINGDYYGARLSLTVYALSTRENLGSISFGSVNAPADVETFEGKAEYKVPEYGTGFGFNEKLEFRITVDPFYQYMGKVTYRYFYEYEQ